MICLSTLSVLIPSTSHYIDPRTRQDCTENQTTQWDLQLSFLVDAYLNYRSRNSGDGLPNIDEIPMEPTSDNLPSVSLVNIELVDLFSAYGEVLLLYVLIHLQSEVIRLFHPCPPTNTPMRR